MSDWAEFQCQGCDSSHKVRMDGRMDTIAFACLAATFGLCFGVLAVSVGACWPDPGVPLFVSVAFIAGVGIGALGFGTSLWVKVRISDRDTMIVDGNRAKTEKVTLEIEFDWEPFVFLGVRLGESQAYLVNVFGNSHDIWLFSLHPDGQWVSLRMVYTSEIPLLREQALPIEEAKLYGPAWIWEDRKKPNEDIKEMRDRICNPTAESALPDLSEQGPPRRKA